MLSVNVQAAMDIYKDSYELHCDHLGVACSSTVAHRLLHLHDPELFPQPDGVVNKAIQ
jgi:hypothetical protein